MKEGINGSSSLSYDVEIFHPAVLHINSRPSQCLMNFLLSGKSVILEVPRRCGKALSHQLSARCGQLYMHSLTIGRSILGNSPSISEGPGGRVTDYRITDFGEFMQNNKLSQMKTPATTAAAEQRTRARLEQQTKFWPMTFSSTTIFNYKQNLDPILNLMVKQKLKNCEVIECKKCIYSLVDTDKDETLSACAQRTKTPRKHEQWRHMFYELETFLRDHCYSEKHIDILNCFLDIKCKDFTLDKDKAEFEDAVKELEQLSAEYKVNDIQTRDYTTSSQPVRKTVLELWMDQCAKIKPRAEFAGYSSASLTSNGNLKYKLYASMNKNNNSYRKR
ncbi:hypothetical protein O3M35_003638 [Rhynocoris fuscipes]|uniref:Protein asunder n=1 Tax=Rhynocoris fuscipes TaxID=488301 RepID=A0AAW1CNQ0_9HEMI